MYGKNSTSWLHRQELRCKNVIRNHKNLSCPRPVLSFQPQRASCQTLFYTVEPLRHLVEESRSATLSSCYLGFLVHFLFSPSLISCVSVLLPPSLQQQNMRENKEKQALGDLMIKPVQRIPRYELLVKVNYLKM